MAPVAAPAQQTPPVVGFLARYARERTVALIAAMRDGLVETGLVEGKDYTSEYRSAGGDANLDLPVQRATKFDFVINLSRTCREP